MKLRFIEPANLPYRRSIQNLFVYDKYIRTPSNGLLTLATIARRYVEDTKMYSESISKIPLKDLLDADIIFLSLFTFNANRGYRLADFLKKRSRALIVLGGLHPTLCPEEAARHCHYVLTGEGDESIVDFILAVRDKKPLDFPGLAFFKDGKFISTGRRQPPADIDVIPDRGLLYRFQAMAGHNTIWPQVHASRGCPHCCDYCALVAAFGRGVRTRSPENVVEDIRQAIAFFDQGHHRLAKVLWITDDNFFANRAWAIQVLNAIIASGIRYQFTIQARFEVGFDDEMLELLKKAGFIELAMGIEFLEDESFKAYHKESTYRQILKSVRNIRRHGLRVRGLFIVGADNHTVGVGKRLARFVIENHISGVLIQSMYFIPGTPVYETHKDRLIGAPAGQPSKCTPDWSRCTGKVVHYPEKLSPSQLQREIIDASRRIYSLPRLADALIHQRGIDRLLFLGEFFWQAWVRRQLKSELPWLSSLPASESRMVSSPCIRPERSSL